jgi:acetylornithine deacetylase
MHKDINQLHLNAIQLLKQLIAIPSFSKEEEETASLLSVFLMTNHVAATRVGNNLFAKNHFYNPALPTILLNSHHDTVKPNKAYTLNPFEAIEKDGKLFGLGSNDAGGCLVALMATFLHYYFDENLKYNIVLAATAEEENSGAGGIEMVLPYLGPIDFGIVGEPTLQQMAVAERGLMVIDATAKGVAGHAARNEGENALYKALADIERIKQLQFSKTSTLLGNTSLNVTVINTPNTAHNVVPASCNFVIDVRINELYTFEEIIELLRQTITSEFSPRSTRMRSTSISLEHPICKAGLQMGKSYYGSPTTSDKALMPFPTLKIGPGDSARSHTADEFIFIDEIKTGIEDYIALLQKLVY